MTTRDTEWETSEQNIGKNVKSTISWVAEIPLSVILLTEKNSSSIYEYLLGRECP